MRVNGQLIDRYFSAPRFSYQDIWRHRTARLAKRNFASIVAYYSDKEDLPGGYNKSLSADQTSIFCWLESTNENRCFFVARYGNYVTCFITVVDSTTITFDDFRQMLQAVDNKMSSLVTD